jgi:hypothetical protein
MHGAFASGILAIWRRIKAKRQSVRVETAKFHVRQHVRISKEKMKFGKALRNRILVPKYLGALK